VAHIMTTKELSQYLKLHEITICKYAAQGKIPAFRIGRVWRFDKDVIDDWISAGQNEKKAAGRSQKKGARKNLRRKSQGNEKNRLIWVVYNRPIFKYCDANRNKMRTIQSQPFGK
jgi:excisionase family DNA binding protein